MRKKQTDILFFVNTKNTPPKRNINQSQICLLLSSEETDTWIGVSHRHLPLVSFFFPKVISSFNEHNPNSERRSTTFGNSRSHRDALKSNRRNPASLPRFHAHNGKGCQGNHDVHHGKPGGLIITRSNG